MPSGADPSAAAMGWTQTRLLQAGHQARWSTRARLAHAPKPAERGRETMLYTDRLSVRLRLSGATSNATKPMTLILVGPKERVAASPQHACELVGQRACRVVRCLLENRFYC